MEVLGILGNLSFPEIDFEKVVRELDLLPFISLKLKVQSKLLPLLTTHSLILHLLVSSSPPSSSPPLQDPSVKDDILLEVINLCGTFSLDEKCAGLLVQAKLTDLLVTLLKGTHITHTPSTLLPSPFTPSSFLHPLLLPHPLPSPPPPLTPYSPHPLIPHTFLPSHLPLLTPSSSHTLTFLAFFSESFMFQVPLTSVSPSLTHYTLPTHHTFTHTLHPAKQEDDELVLQIVYVFHQLVLHDSTRQSLTKESRIPPLPVAFIV